MNFEPNYPSILLSWIALIGGLILLTAGGEFLVSGAAKLAKRLGMSSMLIGLTIVAFGTSMPELFVGLIALFQDHPDILTGNVIGSNIANIGLILGLCAIITPLPVRGISAPKKPVRTSPKSLRRLPGAICFTWLG